jgi:hypothetical protein
LTSNGGENLPKETRRQEAAALDAPRCRSYARARESRQSGVTAERFAQGMTFDQYVAYAGTPENLAREAG